MRKYALIFGLFIAVLIISLSASLFFTTSKKGQNVESPRDPQNQDRENATQLLDNSKPEEALEIIHQYKGEMELQSENGVKWLGLFIRASEQTKDTPQLVLLFEFSPEAFKEQEEAALLVADYYIANNQIGDYQEVRKLWTDRESKIASWFNLDVDLLLLDGRDKQAIDLLKSRTFENKEDVGRLVRLALLYTNQDPKAAWKYLSEAYSKDPQNPDIHFYRARLLESVEKNNLAHKEYYAAMQLNPKNLFFKTQLADFYLRQKQYPMSLEIWQELLSSPSQTDIWVKALFWQKVTTPIDFDWKNTPIPQGKFEPFIIYLAALEKDRFWNQEKFNNIENSKFFLQSEQATFWLRLLDALKNKNEKEALALLKYNPFATVSWNPELERALKRVLSYRANRTFKLENALLSMDTISTADSVQAELPIFFQQLEELASDNNESSQERLNELQGFLLSEEVFSAIFLAAKWYEAGLQLHALPVYPEDFPEWVAFNFTQALHHNRSALRALEFATLQKPSTELSLLTAELMISGGDADAALEKLTQLATSDSDIGYRSAWLASLLYIEAKDYTNAREVISSQPRLANDIVGKESLARIAHLEGDNSLADKLYLSLEEKSAEARSYLSRKAFKEKDWERAHELTERLIQDYPDNPVLRKNLAKIVEEERKEEAASP